MSVKDLTILEAASCLEQGKIIAYPTEAVYGLGCDPTNSTALNNLVLLKKRSLDQGVILIASSIEQLEFYVNTNAYINALSMVRTSSIISGGLNIDLDHFTTWVLPINQNNIEDIHPIIYGKHDSIAIRVSTHPIVVELCNLFNGPIISTSANISGQAAIKDKNLLQQLVADNPQIAGIVEGALGGYDKPSQIINGITGQLIR